MKSVHSVGKRSALRRRTIGVITILLVLSGALLVRRFMPGSGGADEDIARVDGVPIHASEFGRAARLYRDRVAAGDITAETALRDALDDSVRIKIRQLIAQEEGVYPDISYEDFLRQLQQRGQGAFHRECSLSGSSVLTISFLILKVECPILAIIQGRPGNYGTGNGGTA